MRSSFFPQRRHSSLLGKEPYLSEKHQPKSQRTIVVVVGRAVTANTDSVITRNLLWQLENLLNLQTESTIFSVAAYAGRVGAH
jgi:hypothetical protein